jgi:peptidyl-prolyl cis-trans isomerase C
MDDRMITREITKATTRGIFTSLVTGILASTVLLHAVQAAEPTDRVVARVNGIEIRTSDLANAERDIGSQNLPAGDEVKKKELLLNYVTDMVLVSSVAKRDWDQLADDLKRQMDYARKKVLMDRVLADASKGAVTEASVKSAYDNVVKEIGAQVEIRVRDIPFRFFDPKVAAQVDAAEANAEKALIRLRKGESFEVLAREVIESPTLKDRAGDLGYMSPEQLKLIGLSDEVSKLNVGEYSQKPIKTVLGWHIIKIEDKRHRVPPEMAAIRPQLEAFIVRKAQLDFMSSLRAQAMIEPKNDMAKPAAK